MRQLVPIEQVKKGDYVFFQGQVRRVAEAFTRWDGYTRIVCEGLPWPLLEGYAGRDKVEVVKEGAGMRVYEVGVIWEKHRVRIEARNSTEAKRKFCKMRGRNPNDVWSGISILTAKRVKE